MPMTCAQSLLHLLSAYGVDTVFGLPGVHTVELYRGLPEVSIDHITPRHEQGAGFMADGYARASGKPGVCFLITGPGVTNAITAMGQSYADSVPVLIISSVNPLIENPKGEGRLHELRDQRSLSEGVTAFSATVTDPDELPALLARAFAVFDSARPRPVHIEIPTDVFAMRGPDPHILPAPFNTPAPSTSELDEAASILSQAKSPAVLIGGGALEAGTQVQTLVEKIDAVLHHTIAAKGIVPFDHPNNAGGVIGGDVARDQLAQSDVVLIVGSEVAPTDLWPHDELPLRGRVIRIDIESRQFDFTPRAQVALWGDAEQVLTDLNRRVTSLGVTTPEKEQTGAARARIVHSANNFDEHFERWLRALRASLPDDAVIAADSTQIVYMGNASFPMRVPRCWLTSVTGYGTLGYALPAAIGAKLSSPHRRVVCIAGDGGFQFTSQELMTATQNNVAIDVVIWNNGGYGEIRDSMNNSGVRPEGVDVSAPNFELLARACGAQFAQIDDPASLESVIGAPPEGPRVIEIVVT